MFVLESRFLGVSDHFRSGPGDPDGPSAPPWFQVRLTFGDGAVVDARAVVSEGRITIGDVQTSGPPPAPDAPAPAAPAMPPAPPATPEVPAPHRRARPSWPRGRAGRRLVAETYRAAQGEGRDPVLAVMRATGHSRRKALRLVAAARDAGLLSPRHNRR